MNGKKLLFASILLITVVGISLGSVSASDWIPGELVGDPSLGVAPGLAAPSNGVKEHKVLEVKGVKDKAATINVPKGTYKVKITATRNTFNSNSFSLNVKKGSKTYAQSVKWTNSNKNKNTLSKTFTVKTSGKYNLAAVSKGIKSWKVEVWK